MTASVIYRSIFGNSQRLAFSIASELGCSAHEIKNAPCIDNVDVLFFVGGLYTGGKSNPETVSFARTLTPENARKVVLITCSASKQKYQYEVREALINNGMNVATEEFTCHWSLRFFKMGHPNKQEIAEAVAFAKRMLK